MKRMSISTTHSAISHYISRMRWKKRTIKQKALWAFTLIFWLIGALTFFSIKTQEQMTPKVTTIKAEMTYSSNSPAKLPIDCLQVDDSGIHLYEIYDGSGWETGTRVREIQDYSVDENNVLLGNSGWGEYVQYTSKPLTGGELVDVVNGGEKIQDYWLAIFQDEVPAIESFDCGVDITAQTEKALLLLIESDIQPFMEGRAKSRAPMLAGAQVYSMTAMKQFLGNFIYSGLLAGIFIIVLILWAYGWYQSRSSKRCVQFMFLNLGLSIVLLGWIPAILHLVDLPSSLLPSEHITNLSYFFREFEQIFTALNSFASIGHIEIVDSMLQMQVMAKFGNLGIMLLAGGFTFLIVNGEEFLSEEFYAHRLKLHD